MAVHEHKQCHFCSEDLPFPHPAVRRGKCGYKLAAELQSRLSHVSCRALTWEGAAEAMPARMSRCCLRKIFPSPYKEILKAKYFSSNLGNWSGSIFRLARVCEGLSSFFFDLLSHGGGVPSLCFMLACSGGLAGNLGGTRMSFSVWYAASYVHN